MESPSTPLQLTQGLDLVESIASVNTPINLIPPEILSKIFLACTTTFDGDSADDIDGDGHFIHDADGYFIDDTDGDAYSIYAQRDSQGEFTSGSHLPWIEITRICRHWRSVALSCPELWRGLIFSSGKATKEMIRLSKGAALIVKVDGLLTSLSRGTEMFENVRMAITELERISVLHLRYPVDLLQPLVDGLLAAAPILQSLRLGTEFESYLPFTFPEAMFNQCTPSLRLLALSHCKFVWKSLPLRGLTHLELRKPAIPPKIAQILSFLRESHILDTLILDRAVSTDSKHSRTTSLRIFLPTLYRLTLNDSVDHCADLLECITYSAKTRVSINCKISPNEGIDRMFYAIQSAAAYGEGEYVIHALGLSPNYIGVNRLTLKCWAVNHSAPPLLPAASQHSMQPAQLTFTSFAPYYGGNKFLVPQVLRAAGTAICLTDVQTLYMGREAYEADSLFFLRLLPNVHSIHSEERIPVLASNGMEEKSNASTTPLLPRLRSLWLNGVSFAARYELVALLTLLQYRLRYGVAIEHIFLRYCSELSEDDVTRLKEFVEHVDWDGIEKYPVDWVEIEQQENIQRFPV